MKTLSLREVRGALPFFKIYKDVDLVHDCLYRALLTIEAFYDITKNECLNPGACGGDCYPCSACVNQVERGKQFFREFVNGA